MDMNVVMMLRLNRNPATPQAKSTALSTRYQEMGTAFIWRSPFLSARENDRAHDGDEDEHRSDFEGQQEVAEEEAADLFRAADEVAEHGGAGAAAEDENERDDDDSDGGSAEGEGDAAAASQRFFFAGIEQHDGEDEQHHDGAGVDDDLHGGDELRAE